MIRAPRGDADPSDAFTIVTLLLTAVGLLAAWRPRAAPQGCPLATAADCPGNCVLDDVILA